MLPSESRLASCLSEVQNFLLSSRTAEERLLTSPMSFWQSFKHLSKISFPRVFSYTFSLQVFIDNLLMVLMSNSEQETASIALISVYLNSCMVLGVAPLYSISNEVSKLLGAIDAERQGDNNQQKIDAKQKEIISAFCNGLLMSSFISLPLISAFYWSGSMLTNVFRQDEIIASHGQSFLRPYALGVVPMLFRICCQQVLFSFHYERPTMVMGIVTLLLGVGISALLGFGLPGVQSQGFAGVSAGSIIESYLTAIFLGLSLVLLPELRNINFLRMFSSIEGRWMQLGMQSWLGTTFLLGMASEAALPVVTSAAAGVISVNAQAAWTFVMQLNYFLVVPTFAFSHQCYQEVSRYIGAESYENANRLAKYGVATTLIYLAPFAIIMSLLPWVFDFGEADTHHLLLGLLPLMSVGLMIESVRYNILQQLKPLGNQLCSSLTSSMCLVIGMLAAVVFGVLLDYGIYSVAFSYTACILLATTLLFPDWQQRIRPEKLAVMQSQTSSTQGCWPCGQETSDVEGEGLTGVVQQNLDYGTGSSQRAAASAVTPFWQTMSNTKEWLTGTLSCCYPPSHLESPRQGR